MNPDFNIPLKLECEFHSLFRRYKPKQVKIMTWGFQQTLDWSWTKKVDDYKVIVGWNSKSHGKLSDVLKQLKLDKTKFRQRRSHIKFWAFDDKYYFGSKNLAMSNLNDIMVYASEEQRHLLKCHFYLIWRNLYTKGCKLM